MVLWPSGEGNWLTSSRSTVRVCPGLLGGMALIRLSRSVSAKHACFEVESRKRLNGLWPIGPAWSGRHPVTVEIAGSNPVWVAW